MCIVLIVVILPCLLLILYYENNKEFESETLSTLAQKQEFYIGSAVSSDQLGKDEKYEQLLSQEVNIVTTENEMKFDLIHPEKYLYNFSSADEVVDFAKENNQKIRGHTLVWHKRVPDWLEKGNYSKDEMKEILKGHIQTVVGRYKDEVYAWDVVNEAFNEDGSLRDSIWLRTIGEEYISLSFQWAHEADPDALLFYNDYDIGEKNSKSNAIYEMFEAFKVNNVPIDGIGMQMHIKTSIDHDYNEIHQNMGRYNDLGVQVQITELDVSIEEGIESIDSKLKKQTEIYSKLLDTCLHSEACTAFVMWGITDKYTPRGLNEYPLIFDHDYEPKDAYWALKKILNKNSRNRND